MSITLTDIPAAIDDYLQTEVTTTISPVTPKDTTQDVLTPGQEGSVTVTVTNSDAAKGLRLIEPVYYFEVDDGDVLKETPVPARAAVAVGVLLIRKVLLVVAAPV